MHRSEKKCRGQFSPPTLWVLRTDVWSGVRLGGKSLCLMIHLTGLCSRFLQLQMHLCPRLETEGRELSIQLCAQSVWWERQSGGACWQAAKGGLVPSVMEPAAPRPQAQLEQHTPVVLGLWVATPLESDNPFTGAHVRYPAKGGLLRALWQERPQLSSIPACLVKLEQEQQAPCTQGSLTPSTT